MKRHTSDKVNSYPNYEYSSLKIHDGVKKIIIFCILTVLLPMILIILPLYLRHIKYADVIYSVSESDVVEIHEGLSNLFCNRHSLKMNSSFNAFQVNKKSIITGSRKHIRLKKSMILPDDTLEYWGFYLLKGATVELKVCGRFDGSNLLVTKGEKQLNTCGLLNDYLNKVEAVLADGHEKVSVTFEKKTTVTNFFTDVSTNNRKNIKVPWKNYSTDDIEIKFNRSRRNIEDFKTHDPNHVLDRGVNHGGNAVNYAEKNSAEKGASSFENGILECYDGNILLNQEFPASKSCTNISFLETSPEFRMVTTHEVIEDGYYYYIFYSDNDITYNNVHAIFDIYKPTLQYANLSESKSCVNQTECIFFLPMWSEEIVIVEVPTNDGIEKNEDDVSLLTSTCHPRMGVYIIFPISVLFVILSIAYL